MPFTHWMIYGRQKEGINPDTAPKAWAEFKEALKEVNLKMAGPWGPFGVPEGGAFMLKGKNADFEKYVTSQIFRKCPLENTRTVSLFTMPWAE
jgi:hypothetical protein